ncbi:MAG: C39 family peptidase [Anaerostipes sp.]|nr:C39 family peptidase [Anaerostipes sp.]
MKKYSALFLAGVLSICTVTSMSGMTGNSNYTVYAQEIEGAKRATEASEGIKQTTEASTNTASTTEATTEAKPETSTTEKTSTTANTSTTHKNKTKKKKDKKNNKDKKSNKIKTKDKVKKLEKDKNLKEEKVVNNIIPKVYNDTRLNMKNQKEYIGKFIYFNQVDSAWNQNGYCIHSSGCGPTAMAVCISSLTGKWVTPLDTTIWAYNNGYYTNAGSSHDMIPALAKQYDLTCNGLGTNYGNIKAALKAGNPVVALMGPGYFTKGGHFIVLVGIDDKDQVTVADVASRERSAYKYTLKDVIAQSKSASAGGPFWGISPKTKAEQKKEAKIKKEIKVNKQLEYRCKDLKSVLQYGYELAVPMKKGTISATQKFVTLTGIDGDGKVSIQGQDKKVSLVTVAKELNQKAIKGTFWEMVHPLHQNKKPTMSDFLMK